MNIIFLKGLFFSLAIHTFVISFFFYGNNFKKSETSMTEIIILSSNENDSLKRKKQFNKEVDKQTLEAKNEISDKDKTNYFDKNEFDKTLTEKLSQPITAKINTNDIYLSPNKILNNNTKIKKNISSETKDFSGKKILWIFLILVLLIRLVLKKIHIQVIHYLQEKEDGKEE